MLSYWFWPNPGNASYDSPKVLVLFAVCGVLFLVSFLVVSWRRRTSNAVTRKLSRSWPRAMRWFAIIGIALVVSRVEAIQFLSMRFLWAVWGLALLAFIGFQVWWFRKRHYTVVQKEKVEDPRAKYLP